MITTLSQRFARHHKSILFVRLAPVLTISCMLLLLFVPYAKSLIAPLKIDLQNKWVDGVCIQTTPSTCGPSSAATILHLFGISVTERELARECYTCGTGTENWYLARAMRSRGLVTDYRMTPAQPTMLPTPSISGTQLGGKGGAGHFIAILSHIPGGYIIGDPIGGRRVLTLDQIRAKYYITGFFMVFRKE